MINSRLVSVEERQSILDRIQTAFLIGIYPTSTNDPLMQDLQRLINDATEKVISKKLKTLKANSK